MNVIAQIRLLNKYNKRIIINNKLYNLNNDNNKYCYLCSEENNLFHSLIECKLYLKQREKYFHEIVNIENPYEIFLKSLCSENIQTIKKLEFFITKVMQAIITNVD